MNNPSQPEPLPAKSPPEPPASTRAFLKDVLLCSLGAYGGPESHLGVFLRQLVEKRGYCTEDELLELNALCTMLPGPSSTQTIVALGHKLGGPRLAGLTMLVWALPAVILMTLASFLYTYLARLGFIQEVTRFLAPMAIGFVVFAGVRITGKVLKTLGDVVIFAVSAGVTVFYRQPWVFPLVLLAAGGIGILRPRGNPLTRNSPSSPVKAPWGYLAAFAGIALAGISLATLLHQPLVQLFESFYRYGYLVIGGGQVVVPLMQSELVDGREYMTNQEFLSGFGLVQGLPGPMFSFAAYAGGMAARPLGALGQVGGGLIGAVGIFLPGLLLLFFIYPLWQRFRSQPVIQRALEGIKAAAGGLVASAAVVLLAAQGISPLPLGVTALSTGLLLFTRLPPPLLVMGSIIAGIMVQ